MTSILPDYKHPVVRDPMNTGNISINNDGSFWWFDLLDQLSADDIDTEGVYEAAEMEYAVLTSLISDIQNSNKSVKEKADATAKILQKSGYSAHAVAQVTGIPVENITEALIQNGYDISGNTIDTNKVWSYEGNGTFKHTKTGETTTTQVPEGVTLKEGASYTLQEDGKVMDSMGMEVATATEDAQGTPILVSSATETGNGTETANGTETTGGTTETGNGTTSGNTGSTETEEQKNARIQAEVRAVLENEQANEQAKLDGIRKVASDNGMDLRGLGVIAGGLIVGAGLGKIFGSEGGSEGGTGGGTEGGNEGGEEGGSFLSQLLTGSNVLQAILTLGGGYFASEAAKDAAKAQINAANAALGVLEKNKEQARADLERTTEDALETIKTGTQTARDTLVDLSGRSKDALVLGGMNRFHVQ